MNKSHRNVKPQKSERFRPTETGEQTCLDHAGVKNEHKTFVNSIPEAARIVFSATIAALLYALFAWGFSSIYHPNIASIAEEMKAVLFEMRQGDIRPEPLESNLYKLSLLFFPLALWGGYAFTHSRAKYLNLSAWFESTKFSKRCLILCLLVWLAVGVAASLASNPFVGESWTAADVYKTCFEAYFGNLMLCQKVMVPVAFFVLIWFIFFGILRLERKRLSKVIAWMPRIASYASILLLLVYVVLMNATDFPETWQNQYDLNPVMFSQTQVYAGNAMLVNELINIYGLYPHFLNPIFQIVGLTTYTFTLVMSLLIVAGFIFIGLALRSTVKNRLLGALGLVSVIFLTYVSGKTQGIEGYDSYFPTFPIRTFFPFLALWLASKQNKPAYYSGCLLLPLGILFDPDLGLVAFVAWSAYILYTDLFDEDGRVAWKKEIRNMGCLIGGFLLSWGIFTAIIRIKYGAVPEYSFLLDVMQVYSKGFYTLPMTLIHPWMVVVLIGIAGLAWAVAKFYKKNIRHHDAFILMLSLMTFGSFAYFQSRSHNANLWIPATYAILLLVLFSDVLFARLQKGEKIYWLPFTVVLFFISFSLPESYAKIPQLQRLSAPYHGNKRSDDKPRIAMNKTFMAQHLQEGEKAAVLTSKKYYALYYTDKKLSASVYPGYLEIYLKRSYRHMLNTMLQSPYPVFVDATYFYYPDFNAYRALIAARYEVKAKNANGFSLLRVRNDSLIKDTLLMPGKKSDLVLYRKYTEDTAGYWQRVSDAAGIGTLIGQNRFRAGIIFKNTPQHYQAVLLSNMKDQTGFAFYALPAQRGGTDINVFRLTFGGRGVDFELPMNQWCNVVIRIDGSRFEISNNGMLLARYDMGVPYIDSPNMIYIGNQEVQHNFVGAISEVCISKN